LEVPFRCRYELQSFLGIWSLIIRTDSHFYSKLSSSWPWNDRPGTRCLVLVPGTRSHIMRNQQFH
jgi:hypothetical protein